jgi:hypothetical protein
MLCATIFNVAGLIANLVGVVLLFRYGTPYRVRTEGETPQIGAISIAGLALA